MKILLIAQFNTFPFEGGNSRFTYLLDKFDYKKDEVEFITSRFRHGTKTFRDISDNEKKKLKYKLTLLDEPGYNKNVSLKRLYSHKVLSNNLKRYLNNLNYKPDLIYCAVPSLDVAKVAVKFANKNNIKFIIDIQDLWPEAFKMAINIPIISDIIFYPMMRQANFIYSHSDEIVAVSQTYVNRGLEVNKKVKKGLSVFLGTDLNYFDKCAKENKVEYNDDMIRIAYIGTLGTSYDIKSIIDAIKILNEKGINNIKFVVMGDGPLKQEFEEYAKEKNVNCEFAGKLYYSKMVGVLCSCDIAVNPIVGVSVASIINKVGDYAAASLPVINTMECKEYRDLVENYNIGFNCVNNDYIDLSEKLKILIEDKKLRKQMGKNNRKLAEEKFDRLKTYNSIVKIIEM